MEWWSCKSCEIWIHYSGSCWQCPVTWTLVEDRHSSAYAVYKSSLSETSWDGKLGFSSLWQYLFCWSTHWRRELKDSVARWVLYWLFFAILFFGNAGQVSQSHMVNQAQTMVRVSVFFLCHVDCYKIGLTWFLSWGKLLVITHPV